MYKCKTCGKEYENRHAFLGHCSSHKRGSVYTEKRKSEVPKIINLNHRCIFCKTEFKSGTSLGGHIVSCLKNPKRALWLNAVNLARTPQIMSIENRKMHSIRMSLNNSGGRCKWYTVNGIKVQGTWEKAVAEQLTYANIKWHRGNNPYGVWSYKLDEKVKSYTPDFYLPEYNLWLELKGYWWGNDKEKMRVITETYPQRKILIIEKDLYNSILTGDLTILSLYTINTT